VEALLIAYLVLLFVVATLWSFILVAKARSGAPARSHPGSTTPN
jgi:hypothetical protein